MSTIVIRVLIFFVTLALFAGIFWLGGFNFDRRGDDVAFGALISIALAVYFAACPHIKGQP